MRTRAALGIVATATLASLFAFAPAADAINGDNDIRLGPIPQNNSVHFPVHVEPQPGWFLRGSEGQGSGFGPGIAVLLDGDCTQHQTTACTFDGLFIAEDQTGDSDWLLTL